jgi:hypothetical protein
MRKEVQTKLDELFAQGAAREQAAGEAEDARETEEEKFVRSFIEKRNAVIRPAMEAFGEYVTNKGLAYEITAAESGFERTSGGDTRENEPLIEITFFKGEKRHPRNDYPGLRVMCRKQSRSVHFHERAMWPSGGGHAGSAGEASLEAVTEDLVHQKLLHLLTAVLQR